MTIENSSIDAGSLTAGAGATSPLGLGHNGVPGSTAGSSLFLMGGTATFGVDSGNAQTIAGSIAESTPSSITVTGGGTLTLSGNSGGANGFSGGSSVTGGSTLSIAADNALGAAAGGVALSAGGALQITGTTDNSTARNISVGTGGGAIDVNNAANTFTVSRIITGGGLLTKVGAGTLLLSANNSYSGGTTVNNGTLRLQIYGLPATAVVITSPGILLYDTSGGNMNQLRADLSGTGTLQVTGGHQLVFGNIGSNAINWNFSDGALIDLEGNSTLVGGTSDMDNWANNNAALNIASGSTFSGVEANVQIDGLTGGGIFQGGYSFGGVETIGIANGSGLFSGSFQDTATASGYYLSLVKAGTGTENLSGTNTYSGGTTVNNGTLKTTSLGSLGDGSLAVNAAAGITSLMNLGNNQTVSSLSGTVASTGSATLSIAAGKTLIVNQSGGDTNFGGTLADSGTLDKQGTSKLTIGGVPTFGNGSALNVDGGTLRLSLTGAPTIGTSVSSTVASGATLELAGTISDLGVAAGSSSGVFAVANNSRAATTGGLHVTGTNQQVGALTGTGNTVVESGAAMSAYEIKQNSLSIIGTGAVALVPSGTGSSTSPASPNNINFSSNVAALAIGGTTDAWTGTLDIGNNGLIIAYGTGSDPFATVTNMIKSGYANGQWTGAGITSSLARAAVLLGSPTPSLNIGLIDFVPNGPGFGSSIAFEGQTVTTSAVLVRLTYMDDLVLAGDMQQANATSDALFFAANYGSGTIWHVGDITHDGVIDTNDALLFAANYVVGLPSLDGSTGNAAALAIARQFRGGARAGEHRVSGHRDIGVWFEGAVPSVATPPMKGCPNK